MGNVQTEVPPVTYSPYPRVWRASSEVELRKVQCCCGVGMVPELGTFRSAQRGLFSLASLEEGQAKRWPLGGGELSLLAPGEVSAGWGKCRAGRDYFTWSLATSWAGTSIVPHPAWQAKELSHLIPQVTTGLMWLSANLEKNCPLSETPSSDGRC